MKRQVGNILKSVFTAYRFQTFGEYSAMLSCFNIEAKQVRGDFEGTPYNGIVYTLTDDSGRPVCTPIIVYTLTDDSGRPVCTPIKSSLIGKRFGYEGIEKRIAANVHDFRNRKWQPKIRDDVALAVHGCRGNREDFVRLLGEKGIDVVFRENEPGK